MATEAAHANVKWLRGSLAASVLRRDAHEVLWRTMGANMFMYFKSDSLPTLKPAGTVVFSNSRSYSRLIFCSIEQVVGLILSKYMIVRTRPLSSASSNAPPLASHKRSSCSSLASKATSFMSGRPPLIAGHHSPLFFLTLCNQPGRSEYNFSKCQSNDLLSFPLERPVTSIFFLCVIPWK